MSKIEYYPMLCKTGSRKDLNKKDFIFEPKLDGTRALVFINDKIKIMNRRGNIITKRYPEITDCLRKSIKAKQAILDGEIIVYNKGIPDFNLLQSREQLDNKFLINIRSKEFPATYFVFDILKKDGLSLISYPLFRRKEILKNTVDKNKNVQLVFYTKNGKKLFNEMKRLKLEGVVAKKLNSYYYPDRRENVWLKIKNLKTIDCVVVGYTSKKRLISALCLAVYVKNRLLYIGRVAAGLSEDLIDLLLPKIKKLEQRKIPVINLPSDWRKHKIKWLKPKLMAEVEYLELTNNQELRSPVLKRIRQDKLLKECTFENA